MSKTMSITGLERIVRPDILRLNPYSSARSEFTDEAEIFLDANENSLAAKADACNARYPDPQQLRLKNSISRLKGTDPAQLFTGSGSDEAIDLLIRACCAPGSGDSIILCPPTYGMYEVAARIQGVPVCEVPLTKDFQPDVPALLEVFSERTKLLFLCSPNNPTGNLLCPDALERLLVAFPGLVVLDEAYIDFVAGASWLPRLKEFPRLVVLQTLSKGWGMAGVRIGMAFAGPAIIKVLNKIKPPYNISAPAQQAALAALEQPDRVHEWVEVLCRGREQLILALQELPVVEQIFPSDANFLLVRFRDAARVCDFLRQKGIIVRDRSSMLYCRDCLRITVGTPAENEQLINTLKTFDL